MNAERVITATKSGLGQVVLPSARLRGEMYKDSGPTRDKARMETPSSLRKSLLRQSMHKNPGFGRSLPPTSTWHQAPLPNDQTYAVLFSKFAPGRSRPSSSRRLFVSEVQMGKLFKEDAPFFGSLRSERRQLADPRWATLVLLLQDVEAQEPLSFTLIHRQPDPSYFVPDSAFPLPLDASSFPFALAACIGPVIPASTFSCHLRLSLNILCKE
jgi:hypothetical protein